MKRLSVLAMAMIVMASCAKENVQPNNEPSGEKQLLEIGLASTKTQLGTEDKVNNLFPIVWSDGDEIAVIENMGVEGKQNVSVYRLKMVPALQWCLRARKRRCVPESDK